MLILVDETLHTTGDMGLGLPTIHIYIYIYVFVYSSYNYSKNGYLLSHQTWLECWIFPALSASIDRSIAGTSSLGTKSRCSNRRRRCRGPSRRGRWQVPRRASRADPAAAPRRSAVAGLRTGEPWVCLGKCRHR